MFTRTLKTTAAAAALAVTAAGCGQLTPPDPHQQVADGLAELQTTSYNYKFTVDLDDSLLEGTQGIEMSMLQALGTLKVSGAVADDAVAADVELLGTPLFATRVFTEIDRSEPLATAADPLEPRELDVYANVDIPSLVEAFDGNPSEIPPLAETAAQQGLPDDIVALVEAIEAGNWAGVTGTFDPAEFVGEEMLEQMKAEQQEAGADTEKINAVFNDVVGDDPAEFLRTYATFTEVEDVEGHPEGTTVYDVTIDIQTLATDVLVAVQAEDPELLTDEEVEEAKTDIEELPAEMDGLSVAVADGHLTMVRIDVGAIANTLEPQSSEDISPGQLVFTLELSNHGSATVEPPADAATVTWERIAELAEQQMGAGAALGAAPPTPDVPDAPPAPEVNLRTEADFLVTVLELYRMENGSYTADTAELAEAGLFLSDGVAADVAVSEDASAFCAVVTDRDGNSLWATSEVLSPTPDQPTDPLCEKVQPAQTETAA